MLIGLFINIIYKKTFTQVRANNETGQGRTRLICNGLRVKVRIFTKSTVAYWLREAGLFSKGR